MSLLGEERKDYILKIIDEKGKVKANELALELNVSTETIRRDLDQLETKNQLKKVYGGAVKVETDLIEPSQYARENIRIEEKRRIGRAAAQLINDNEIVIVDEGSTTLQMINYLTDKKNITLITNSVPALMLLIDYKIKGLFHGQFIFIGGEVDAEHLRVSGMIAKQFMNNFYADKAFISIHGVTKDYGVTSYNSNEAILSMKFMECAREKIVLFDRSKVGLRKHYKIAELSEFDTLICDEAVPSDWKEELAEKGIEWIVAD